MSGKNLLLFFTLCYFITGCSNDKYMNLSIVSTTQHHLENIELSEERSRSLGKIEGSDSRFWLTLLPLGFAPTPYEAIDDALSKTQGGYLRKVVVQRKSFHLLLFGWDTFQVFGQGYRFPSSDTPVSPASESSPTQENVSPTPSIQNEDEDEIILD
ncbi:hypothetical protein [Candidatus Uabimicrobium amorphum]|uniref:Lipoprotein n=1 Tax=Uabimicrobium amorphum TaxID=2596890 RepID=A0A5S9IRC3_UABAM|nr:hypothetical protein [Candidatus Uabimicrobium amorphum]BBM86151.1 hypothetical protein UABAM_04537 [Candidatus Uabimicrobium amorphum]